MQALLYLFSPLFLLEKFSIKLLLVLFIISLLKTGKDTYTNSSLLLSSRLYTKITSKPDIFATVYLGIWILGIWVWLCLSFRSGSCLIHGGWENLSFWARVGKEAQTLYLVKYFYHKLKLSSWRFIFSLVINSKDRC